MKRLLLITFLFFYGGSAWATCNTTVTENTSGNLNIRCNDNDTYVINEGVTVHNTSGNQYFDVENHSGVTITNNGTLKSDYHQGLYLIGFLFVMVFASYGFLIFIAAAYKKIIFKLAN